MGASYFLWKKTVSSRKASKNLCCSPLYNSKRNSFCLRGGNLIVLEQVIFFAEDCVLQETKQVLMVLPFLEFMKDWEVVLTLYIVFISFVREET